MDQYLEFASNHTLLVTGLVASFLVLVFFELQRKSRGMTTVEPQDAVKLINADAVVIDLRSPDAFAGGHIVNAKNLPADELSDSDKLAERFGGKAIIAVCEAGTSSTRAVDRLRKAGVDNVYGLRGGMSAWTQASLPVVGGKKSRKGNKSNKGKNK